MRVFIRELRRRHVFRIAAVYAGVAFVVVQVADITFPALRLPEWALPLVIVLSVLGFPFALVLAWAYDLTPEGIRRTESLPRPRWRRVHELFNEALDVAPHDREAFLRRECAGESGLYREVQSLLAAHGREGPLDRLAEEAVSPLVEGWRSPRDAGPAVAEHSHPALMPAAPPRYEILEKLGGGGMGVVYRARDVRLDRDVALKFLPPHLSSDRQAKQRFLVEAQAAAGLDHPHICTVYEIGETEDGRLFIAMPYYEGETLKARIARGALPVEEALDLALQVARGLARAHERGIVHRDIKPANLMVTADGVAKIVDFGLAKRPDLSLTKSGATLGTVPYMSPEQARGEAVDHRTDLWSLGVVLYEMLIGERPFRAESEHALVQAILGSEPASLTALRPEAPTALAAVLEKALAKRPEDRYASAAEFARALEAARAAVAEPVASQPPSRESRTGESSGRAATVLAPEGERRQASIVVSYLDGYGSLVERLPPDELDRVVQRIRDDAAAVAERHGGILNRCDGEELVLLFGVLASHEDDFLRAARAAFELHERVGGLEAELGQRVGREIRLRSGIGTGLVIAQPLDCAGAECRVTGETVRIAERLAARAAPDEILVGPESVRLLTGFFATEPREPLELGSGRPPVTPHRLLGESVLESRLEAAERAGLTTYTGRAEELATLRGCLEKALRSEGQFVTILGETGVGKSRLLYEFRRGLDPQRIRLLQGRCRAYEGSQIPYLPFIQMLSDGLGLPRGAGKATHDPELTVARIRSAAPELEDFIPLYLHMLSLQHEEYPLPRHLEGEQFRLAMVEALAAFFTLAARDTPTVLLLEDWHWADDASRDVLKQLAEVVSAYPLLVAVTSRPSGMLDWGNPSQHTPLQLGPLGQEATLSIMRSVFGADTLDEELGRRVHERTGGNPFFIEEICQTLREAGQVTVENGRAQLAGSLDRLHLPETVQAVIRTRLDRLDRRARETLRVASVIGREFNRPLLEHTIGDTQDLGESVETLKALGVIQQTRIFPDAAFRFKHALTAEVAYESLLERQRRALHARVGTAIEDLYAGRTEEYLESLVHHFSQAEELAKSVRYGLRAAERASALSEFSESLALLERVEGWIRKLPDDAERQSTLVEVLLRQERVCERLGLRTRQQEIIERLLSLLEGGEDREKLAEVYLRQGDLYTLLQHFDRAETALERSLHLSRAGDNAVGERNALRSVGLLRWHEGRNEEAVELMEQTLRLDRAGDDLEALVGDLASLGNVLKAVGDYEQAKSCLEEALALTAGGDLPIKRCYILHNLGNIHRAQGETEQALTYLQEAFELTKHWPLPGHSFHFTTIAHIRLQQGRIEESLELYREAVERSRRARHADGLAQSLRMLGEVLVGLDRHAEALPYLEEAAALFAQLANREAEALMRRRLAAAQEKFENHGEATASWRRARELCKQIGDARGELEALEGLARATRRRDEVCEAIEHLQDALALAEKLEDREKQGALLNSIGVVAWSCGDYERALAHYEKALAHFQALGDRVHAGVVLNSIGATLNSLGRPAEAVARLEQAVSIHLQTGKRLLEGHALAALGEAYGQLGKPELALKAYEDSLEIRCDLGDRRGEGWMLYHVARLQARHGLGNGAGDCLTEAAAIAAQVRDRELSVACQGLKE